MPNYPVSAPSDCVASNDPADNQHALKQMEIVLKADITASTELDLEAIKRQAGRTRRKILETSRH